MRDIKFRTWHHGYMDYAFYIDSDGSTYDNADRTYDTPNIEIESTKDWILMQYTGHEDAEINGTEVWESDIIENCDTKDLQIVYWNEDKAAWYCRYVYDESRIVSLADSLGNLNKRIGNIHQNPELINQL